MFQFSGLPSYDYVFTIGWWSIAPSGCPIRTSTNQYLFAAPRGFSQLVASFFGFRCQGILLALFLAWTIMSIANLFLVQSVCHSLSWMSTVLVVVFLPMTNSQPFLFSCLSFVQYILQKLDLLLQIICLIQFSRYIFWSSRILVGSSGLEPPTSRLSGARSSLLSYEPI